MEGKAIKSPLDGFTQVPGSHPPKFIMVQHTTAKLEDLESKWLFDHTTATGKRKEEGNDGDVVKAGQYAQEIRQKNPDAEFVLILTTNRPLSLNKQKGQDPLVLKTYQKCQDYNIHCVIWEQSRITHFLDNTPEGHWLRKEYLGIDAELLSEKLLEIICKINLERYKQSFFLGDDDFLQTEMEKTVEREINTQNQGLHLLIGESGFGKSTISYHLLKKHIESGGFGLWISVENIEEGLPLENIISISLKKLYSNIRIDPETDIWKYAIKQQFFIVIDDLNRASDPTKILRRIISFLPLKSTKTGEPLAKIPFTIISPVWPKYWAPISREFQKNPQVHQTQINKFTFDESESIIIDAFQKQDTQITRLQANQIAKNLGCDPFLIGLFVQFLRHNDIQISLLSKDVIDLFIQRNLEEIAQKSVSHYQCSEYNEVLLKICTEILIQKQFFPTFIQIEDWLRENPKYIHIFRDLITSKILCSMDNERFVFRHDRIQFFLLTQSMVKILESNSLIRSNVIAEPFYAEILGQSILLKEQSDSQLDDIQEKNILSLFESLKIFGEPSTDYHNKIIERIIAWSKEEKRIDYPLPSVIEAICWIIIDTDSSAIFPITDYLPQYYSIQFARIRNGCVDSGIQFCSNYNHFQPKSNFLLRDRIFEHAKDKHHTKILKDLRNILQSEKVSDKQRYGALVFLGFLKFSSFENNILSCWRNTQDKKLILPAALWAGIECCGDALEDTLNPMMDYWASLSSDHEPDSGGLSDIVEVSQYLEFSVTHNMTNRVARYLISQCERHQTLKWPILVVLQYVDDPDAIEFFVKRIALDYPNSFYALSIADHWNRRKFSYGRQLSSQSLDRLEQLWKNDKNDIEVRKKSFRVWQTGANLADIEKVKTILPNTPLFNESVILRTELKDWSVLPEYLSLISENYHYLYVAHHLWCHDIRQVVEKYLDSFKENIPHDFKGGHLNEHYALNRLIMAIPEGDAEVLLDSFWSHLKYSSIFVQSALYIGTQRTLDLAKIAIQECPPDIDIFIHVSSHFWVNDQGRPRTFTKKRLNDLKPYLSRFTKDEIQHLYWTCESCGFREWARENLKGYLSEEAKKRNLYSDNDLLQYLQKPDLKAHLNFYINDAIEENKWGKDTRERLLRIGHRLLTENPSQTNLEIVSIVLKICGKRNDLEIMNNFSYVGDAQKIFKIKQDTQFHIFHRTIE